MKKQLLKSLLLSVLMILGGGTSVWADVVTIYEQTESSWTESDLDDWTTDEKAAITIDGGLKQTATNTDFLATKAFNDIDEYSIVTLTATLTGGSAGGRSGSYDYLTIGGVSLRLNGQDKKASIVIDDVETELKGFVRGGTYELAVTIDQASGSVSYVVSGDAEGEGSGTSTEKVTGVTVGHYKAGKENYEISFTLNSIIVEEKKQVEEAILYEQTESSWAESDLDDWTTDEKAAITIDGGLKQTATNTDFSATKTFDGVGGLSIVTLTATLTGGSAGGRSGSYDYLTIGGVSLRLNGQDKKASIVIDDVETELKGFVRGGTYELAVTIDQASGSVSYVVSGDAEGEGSGTSTEKVTGVTVGHYKAGKENYEISFTLNSIIVEEKSQLVEVAKYAIQYVCDGEIIKEISGTTTIDNVIEAESILIVDGQKYYAVADAETSMVVSAGEDNVLIVELRKAYNYNYFLESSLGGTISDGTGIEDETINVPYPRYALTEDGFYESAKTNNEYRKPITLTEDGVSAKVEYTKIDTVNVVFYVEAEDIENLEESEVTVAGNIPVRASGAKAVVSTRDILITTMPAGKYIFHAGVFTSRTTFDENSTIWFGIGAEPFAHTFTSGNLTEAKSEIFELAEETDIKYWGTNSWDQAQFDYFWIEKITEASGEPLDTCAVPTVTIGDFSFAKKGYEVTFAVAEGDTVSVLNISTDGKTFEKQTSPYVTVADSTTTYYVKAVAEGMAASAVIDTTVTVGYDNKKAYIAYVYDKSYSSGVVFAEEKIVKALQEDYNVVEVACPVDSVPAEDWANADLIISTEAMTGNKALSNGMKNFVGKAPMVALKAYNYNSGRWSWGTPANPSPAALGFTPKNGTYKVLEGVTAEEDGTIQVATETSSNAIQTVSFDGTDAPEDIVVMGTVGGEDAAAAMYASNAQKFFGLGLSSDCWKNYTDNPGIIIKNVAAILIAGGDLTEADPTGISTVNAETANGTVYNLQGQKVTKALKKGLYIINGKKVLVK